jgi:hypothetical protein
MVTRRDLLRSSTATVFGTGFSFEAVSSAVAKKHEQSFDDFVGTEEGQFTLNGRSNL